MKEFLSLDWGTSNFRLRLIDAFNLSVLAEDKEGKGMKQVFDAWNESGGDRFHTYARIIKDSVKKLEQLRNTSLEGIPIFISGMASSSIGIKELPYKHLPFSLDGSDLIIDRISASEDFNHSIHLISGVRTEMDVMRGEETQLVGCGNAFEVGRQICIIPGTHSKHIYIENGKAVHFKTYMTGEFFQLLSQKSILSNSILEGEELLQNKNKESFEKGVRLSVESNILHSSFMVRTQALFNLLTKEENYYFLSGLLIGTELKELSGTPDVVSIISNSSLLPLYLSALTIFKLENNLKIYNADEVTVKGQYVICNKF